LPKIDNKQEEIKDSPEHKAIARNCESAKPYEKDISGGDSTRANTTESNCNTRVMSGKLTEKLQYIKSNKNQYTLSQSKEGLSNSQEEISAMGVNNIKKNSSGNISEHDYLKGKKLNYQVSHKQGDAIKMAGRMLYDPALSNNRQFSIQKRSNCFSEERKANVYIYF
jgi:hypothetical protein